jgi:hypothetical protein
VKRKRKMRKKKEKLITKVKVRLLQINSIN